MSRFLCHCTKKKKLQGKTYQVIRLFIGADGCRQTVVTLHRWPWSSWQLLSWWQHWGDRRLRIFLQHTMTRILTKAVKLLTTGPTMLPTFGEFSSTMLIVGSLEREITSVLVVEENGRHWVVDWSGWRVDGAVLILDVINALHLLDRK